MATVFAFTAPLRGDADGPDGFDAPVSQLGLHSRCAGEHCPGRRLGVDRVGLTPLAPQASIRAGHLDDADALVVTPGQAGPIGAGALDADPVDPTVAAKPASSSL